ncbi:hypothetical protein ACQ4PT_065626 [Festuca glaucescens]
MYAHAVKKEEIIKDVSHLDGISRYRCHLNLECVTLSSEESGSDGEVQSTPEGLVPKVPFVGMVFDSVEAALVHYNRYAKHIGFSVKIQSSRKSTKDGEKDKSVFVCNKSGKPVDEEATPVKQRNRTITVLTDCKAKLRVKRVGSRWHVTHFVEEHNMNLSQRCGFVRNERIADFVWLFEMFLEAMDGLYPDNIITDQDGAIRSAILTILVHTCHRNSRWHIMQKVQERLGSFTTKREDLRRDFNEVIDCSLTIEEFETRWDEMLVKHDVLEHPHFLAVYELREHFVPMYFKHRSFPFLQTIARSEGFNAVLKLYVNAHASLFRFFKQFMKLQEQIDVVEDGNEFVDDDKKLELRKLTSYNARDCGGGMFEVFPIQGSVIGYGRRTYMVDVDIENEIYNCQCCKFNKDGILCCHVMKFMYYLGNVKTVLKQYILPRWSKPTPDIVVQPTEAVQQPLTGKKLSRKDMRMLRYGNLCTEFAKLAVDLEASDKTKEIADKHMKEMVKEMADQKKAAADALKRKKKATTIASSSGSTMTDSAQKEQEDQLAANKHA